MDDEEIKRDKLRKKAEEVVQNQFNRIKNQSKDEEYIHELRVHQIELEIQNEELKEAQIKLEESRRKYFDLYNFAPVGYFTLDKEGFILEVNLTGAAMLGVERSNLHKNAFIQYVFPDHRNMLHQSMKVREIETKQTVELKLLKRDGESFYAHLETINVHDENGNFKEFRIAVTDIKDLKNTETALKESEERYREIFVNSHAVMLLIDPTDGSIVDANPAATNFYGYTCEELIKMKISEINVYDTDLIFDEMQKAVSKHKNHFTFKHRLSNGEIRDVDVYSGVINQKGKPILYSIIHDVIAQKKAETALRNSEELFRLIFDQSPIGSVIGALDYTTLRVNKALTRMLGYSEQELLSMKFTEYTYPDDLGPELEKLKLLISGKIDNFEMEKRYIHKNGEIVWTRISVSTLKDQTNTPVRVLGRIEDITKNKQMENLVKQRTDKLATINTILNVEIGDHEKAEIKLEKIIEKLERSNRDLEQFAYVSSHDLREPLRMITSFLQLLERRYSDDLDEEANEFIQYAVEGAKRLDMMINDLLDYSRIGSQDRKFENINCEKIVKTVLINLKTLIEDNKAVITYDPLPIIYANDQQMVHLFQNLMGNAIKYRGKENPEIHISAEKIDGKYLFQVKDNGIGIDKEHIGRIFTIFQRLHTREEYEGTGIGLAIAEKIIHQHGGHIWAESEPAQGTTFYFTLPITG